MDEQEEKEGSSLIGNCVSLLVLCWSLAVISWSYFGNGIRQIDTTFAAGILSTVLSSYGLTVKKPGSGNGKNNSKPRKDPITNKDIDNVTGRLKK
jgi:hypothetical protein